MRRGGPVSRAGSVCRDLGTSVKHIKNQLCDYMENSQPGWLGSWHRDAGFSASRAENLPCNRRVDFFTRQLLNLAAGGLARLM